MSRSPAHFSTSPLAEQGETSGALPLVATLIGLALIAGFGAMSFIATHDVRTIALAGIGVIVCAGLWLAVQRLHLSLEHAVFPILLVLLCSAYSLFFPISTVPDEGYHFMHAYSFANRMLPDAADDFMRSEDLAFLMDTSLSGGRVNHGRIDASTVDDLRWDALAQKFELTGDGLPETTYPDLEYAFNPSADLPQVRLPAAAGILLARLLDLGAIPLFYLGRFTNLLAISLVIALAIRLAPFGKTPLMVVSLLPISLQQFGSYSYDGPIIALAFLFLALVLRAIQAERMSIPLAVSMLLVGSLLTPAKVIYAVLLLAVLMIPNDRFPNKSVALAFKALVIVVPLALALLNRGSHIEGLADLEGPLSASSYVRRWNTNLGGYEYGRFYSLSDFLENPLLLVYILSKSAISSLGLYVGSAVGSLLGNMEASIALPAHLWIPLALLAIAAILAPEGDDFQPTLPQRLMLLAVAVLTIGGSMAAMLLGCTFKGESIIKGVQGRYFLPALPYLLLGLRPKIPRPPAETPFALVSLLASATFVVLGHIAMVVIST